MASLHAVDKSSTSYPCFQLSMPSAKCLAITCALLALLGAAATGALAYTGPALSFHEWQWIQLPLALTALFTLSAIIFALKCCCERAVVGEPVVKKGADEKARVSRTAPESKVAKGDEKARVSRTAPESNVANEERNWTDHILDNGDGEYWIQLSNSGNEYSIQWTPRADAVKSVFDQTSFHATAEVRDLAAWLKREEVQLKNFVCNARSYDFESNRMRTLLSFGNNSMMTFRAN